MRGMEVCYHHGGKSLSGYAHPNYKHGYYSKNPLVRIYLLSCFDRYRRVLRQLQYEDIMTHLKETMPTETRREYLRFKRVFYAHVAQLPPVKLTPEVAAWIADAEERMMKVKAGKGNLC